MKAYPDCLDKHFFQGQHKKISIDIIHYINHLQYMIEKELIIMITILNPILLLLMQQKVDIYAINYMNFYAAVP